MAFFLLLFLLLAFHERNLNVWRARQETSKSYVAGGDVVGVDVAGGDVEGVDVAGMDVAGGDVEGGDVVGVEVSTDMERGVYFDVCADVQVSVNGDDSVLDEAVGLGLG